MTFNLELSKHASAYVIVSFTNKLYTCDEYKGSIQFPFFFLFFSKSQGTCLGKWQDKRGSMWVNGSLIATGNVFCCVAERARIVLGFSKQQVMSNLSPESVFAMKKN